jgi:hypothetical protein
VSTDPSVFLSTVILANAALDAIVGGLLVGRFVSLDSDQQGSRKVLDDAAGRLDTARKRAAAAHAELVQWHYRRFLRDPRLLDHIDGGRTEPDELRAIVGSGLTDDELRQFAKGIADEFERARKELNEESVASDIREDRSERVAAALLDKAKPRWPVVWRKVYVEVKDRPSKAQILASLDKRLAARRRIAGELAATSEAQADMFLQDAGWSTPSTGADEIEARRHDQLTAADQRASQRVEDLEDEVVRLRQAYDAIVRPDARLWVGVTILVAFAIVGVGIPMWVISYGPTDLSHVRWTFYPFAIGLGALLVYIVWYLIDLTRKRQQTPDVEDTG